MVFNDRRDITWELIEHLENEEVFDADKQLLLKILSKERYGTELQKERFKIIYKLIPEGYEYKNVSQCAKHLGKSASGVKCSAISVRHKLTRGLEEDLLIIKEINKHSAKNEG